MITKTDREVLCEFLSLDEAAWVKMSIYTSWYERNLFAKIIRRLGVLSEDIPLDEEPS